MNHLSEFLSDTILQGVNSSVTAIATIVLAFLTWVLAKATRAMADATSNAQIVASLEANTWSLRHLDLIVENSGNASAFDVEVCFDPPLPMDRVRKERPLPYQKLSVVRPGQSFASYACEFSSVKGLSFKVTTSWKKNPTSNRRDRLEYVYDLTGFEGATSLGRRSPEIQIAEEIKHIRDDWKAIAGGTRKLKIDAYSQTDRESAEQEMNRLFDEHLAQPEDENDSSKA